MQSKVAFMRKLESEIESLEFRNEQLLKRVESLQAEVEELRRVPLKEKVLQFLRKSRFRSKHI